jgi:asparagine synthase (glutamine-hydrolysing)
MSVNDEGATDRREVENLRIVVHGFTTLDRRTIADALRRHDFGSLTTAEGSYVLLAEEPNRIVIATSCDGSRSYFYTLVNNHLFHGPTVLDVVRQASLPWSWNWRALGDLFALEHLLAGDTLHQDVTRTSPASVLVFERGRLSEHRLTFKEAYPPRRVQPDQLVELTADHTHRWTGNAPTLSASAGFDSRLLLAAMLNRRVRPRLLVAGDPKSTDRMVVEAMARRHQLDLITITLKPTDWLEVATEVVFKTGGAKPARHWHTYIYPQRAGLGGEDRLIVGANGEFVRTYYLNFGIAARLAGLGPPSWFAATVLAP